jgi:protease I
VEGSIPTEGQKVLYILADDFTNSYYFLYPGLLEEYGFNVCLAGPTDIVQDMYNNDYEMDYTFNEVTITDFVAIMVLGGSQDYPTNLGDIPEAMTIINDAYTNGLVLFAHDEGPAAFAAADIISGRNITCTSEVLAEVTAAGANFVDEPIVIDGQFVTTQGYSGGVQVARGIIKALGLFEYDPPTIDSFEGEILVNKTPGSVSVVAEVSDVFGVDNLELQLLKYNEIMSHFDVLSELQMTANHDKTVFNSTISNLAAGNYTISIVAFDVLGNNETYYDLFRFIIEGTNTNVLRQIGLVPIITIICSTYFIGILIIEKKKR